MAEATFRAPVRSSDRGGGGHLVDVPTEVVEALGGRGRIPVTATFDGVPYRGSIVRMGGGAVLARDGAARAAFEGLSFSHKREYVRSITDAKRPETRARRIERTVEQLVERAAGDET